MAKSLMTVTRVLAEIKLLDHRIATNIANGPYLGIAKGEEEKMVAPLGFATKARLENSIKAARQSYLALVENRGRLRAALTQSNATTQVTIGGVTRSVAQTVEYKRSVVPLKEQYLSQLKTIFNNINHAMKAEDDSLELLIERQATNLAASSGAGKSAIPTDILTSTRANLEKSLKAKKVDPLDLQELIAKEQEELDNFVTEVDYALSEVNARTQVEVDLVD